MNRFKDMEQLLRLALVFVVGAGVFVAVRTMLPRRKDRTPRGGLPRWSTVTAKADDRNRSAGGECSCLPDGFLCKPN
jgi:hypothetical protein